MFENLKKDEQTREKQRFKGSEKFRIQRNGWRRL